METCTFTKFFLQLELHNAVKTQFVCSLPKQSRLSRIKARRYQFCELVAEIVDEPDMPVFDQLAAISGRHLNDVILQSAGGEARRHRPERAQDGLRLFVDRHDHRRHAAFDQAEAFPDAAIGKVGPGTNDEFFHDGVLVQPVFAFPPVDLTEIGLDRLRGEQIAAMFTEDPQHVANQTLDFGGWPGFRRLEDRDDAVFDGATAFTVAASRGLCQLVEAGLGPPDPWKVDVDTGFDERRRDDTARLAIFKPFAHVAENASPIGSYLPGGQVDQPG